MIMLSTVYHKKALVLKIPPNLPLPKGGVGRFPFPRGDNKDDSHICIKFLPTHFHDEPEKELTDRALKLAEAGKSKSNWELQGLLGLAAFVLGLLVGK